MKPIHNNQAVLKLYVGSSIYLAQGCKDNLLLHKLITSQSLVLAFIQCF